MYTTIILLVEDWESNHGWLVAKGAGEEEEEEEE